MPKVLLPVPNVNDSVSRPIVLEIARQVVLDTGLPSDTWVVYPGDLNGETQQAGSNITPATAPVNLPFSERVIIEVEEAVIPESLLTTSIYGREYPPALIDRNLAISIRPVKAAQDVTINFKFRAQDKNKAISWRDGIRARFSAGYGNVNLHTVTYHYQIPPEFLYILEELHRLRENIGGYGEDFNTYVSNISNNSVVEITTLAGTHPVKVVAEKQTRIQGWYDFEGVPEFGNRDGNGDCWEISFSYKFRFDKPIVCLFDYPIVVHHQVLDQKYRPTPPDFPDRHRQIYSESASSFSVFEKGNMRLLLPETYSIPAFDEWSSDMAIPNYIKVFDALCVIDPADPQYLFNLDQLGDLELDPTVLAYCLKDWQNITKPYQSLYNLSLYRDGDLLTQASIKMDSTGRIEAVNPMNLRQQYHVRLSVCDNLIKLSDMCLNRLCSEVPVLIKSLSAIGYNEELPSFLVPSNNTILSDTFTEPSKSTLSTSIVSGNGVFNGPNKYVDNSNRSSSTTPISSSNVSSNTTKEIVSNELPSTITKNQLLKIVTSQSKINLMSSWNPIRLGSSNITGKSYGGAGNAYVNNNVGVLFIKADRLPSR